MGRQLSDRELSCFRNSGDAPNWSSSGTPMIPSPFATPYSTPYLRTPHHRYTVPPMGTVRFRISARIGRTRRPAGKWHEAATNQAAHSTNMQRTALSDAGWVALTLGKSATALEYIRSAASEREPRERVAMCGRQGGRGSPAEGKGLGLYCIVRSTPWIIRVFLPRGTWNGRINAFSVALDGVNHFSVQHIFSFRDQLWRQFRGKGVPWPYLSTDQASWVELGWHGWAAWSVRNAVKGIIRTVQYCTVRMDMNIPSSLNKSWRACACVGAKWI
jgi:hypothetical protein